MADSRRCTVCGRTLRDSASRARGTGPVCDRKTRALRLPSTRRPALPPYVGGRAVDDVPTGSLF
ncbi:DUF6011 domain-containing protein [Streptomyces sp. PgraA7]|uniref:DUF6011 domain-containing protein n=1 Tax=unclassified Streptomyces TaxID=2593676 RepID=UPI000B50186C|nr:DUF6011 domain-containing protein [Streptomyces sp. PgraA7]MYW99923.1 hypothetical protein [Streptomyces sp. SID8378]